MTLARLIGIIILMLGLAFCSGLLWNPSNQKCLMEAK
jgi:hypothetical protein